MPSVAKPASEVGTALFTEPLDYSQSLNIVFVEPEIPGNTGTIGRLCVGLQGTLTLVEPLGFSLEDKYLKRAGLDYWPHLRLRVISSLAVLLDEVADLDRFHFFSTKATTPYTRADYRRGDFLVFGKETKGLPAELLARHQSRSHTIPMYGPIRSINLAVAAGIVAYEAMRQITNGYTQ